MGKKRSTAPLRINPAVCGNWGKMSCDGFLRHNGHDAAELYTEFRVHGEELIAMMEIARHYFARDIIGVKHLSTDRGGSFIVLIFRDGRNLDEQTAVVISFFSKVRKWAMANPRPSRQPAPQPLHTQRALLQLV